MTETPRSPQSPLDERPSYVVTPEQIQGAIRQVRAASDDENRKLLHDSMTGAGRILALFAKARAPEELASAHQAMVRALATWAASAPAPQDAALLALSHRSLDGIYKEISALKSMLAGKTAEEPTDG